MSAGSQVDKGEGARMSSFVGAIAIADLVKTTLGPKGMDKILQSVRRPLRATQHLCAPLDTSSPVLVCGRLPRPPPPPPSSPRARSRRAPLLSLRISVSLSLSLSLPRASLPSTFSRPPSLRFPRPTVTSR